jgi:hypothetical protein
MRVLLVTSLAVSAAAPAAVARAQGELPPLVVIVEARDAATADRVRSALGRSLSRSVVSLHQLDASAGAPTVVSIVVSSERGAVTVIVPGGPHATRVVPAPDDRRDASFVVADAASLVREVEADVRPESGLASWTGGGARAVRVLSPGLLPWPGDEAVRRETTRRQSEDGEGLSAPHPTR